MGAKGAGLNLSELIPSNAAIRKKSVHVDADDDNSLVPVKKEIELVKVGDAENAEPLEPIGKRTTEDEIEDSSESEFEIRRNRRNCRTASTTVETDEIGEGRRTSSRLKRMRDRREANNE